MPRQNFLAFILNRQGLVASDKTDYLTPLCTSEHVVSICIQHYTHSSPTHTLFPHIHTHVTHPHIHSHPPTHTHGGPPVAAVDVEDLAIEGAVNAQVEILPVPELTKVILGQPLALDQLTLWNTTGER